MMSLEKLLESLRNQRDEANNAIHFIEQFVAAGNIINKRTAIVNGLPKNRKKSYNGTHWMQQPKNRARVIALQRRALKARLKNQGKKTKAGWTAARHKKFSATMKRKKIEAAAGGQ